MNKQHVTVLVLLDVSEAFDTVDHNVLLSRLHSKFGISGTKLEWFRSYLKGQMNQKIDIFPFVALPSPDTKKNHPK